MEHRTAKMQPSVTVSHVPGLERRILNVVGERHDTSLWHGWDVFHKSGSNHVRRRGFTHHSGGEELVELTYPTVINDAARGTHQRWLHHNRDWPQSAVTAVSIQNAASRAD